jgi:hypothetical protein
MAEGTERAPRPEAENINSVDTFFQKYPGEDAIQADKLVNMFRKSGPEAGLKYVDEEQDRLLQQLRDWQKALPRSFRSFSPKTLEALEAPQMDIHLAPSTLRALENEFRGMTAEVNESEKADLMAGRLSTLSVKAEQLSLAKEQLEELDIQFRVKNRETSTPNSEKEEAA